MGKDYVVDPVSVLLRGLAVDSAMKCLISEINESIESDKITEHIYENQKDKSNFWYYNGSREAFEHVLELIKKLFGESKKNGWRTH